MNSTHVHTLVVLCGLVIATGLLVPALCATEPLWTEAGPDNGELSGVVISGDGSTIVAGGDKLIAMTHDGRKLWTGWSADCLAISRDGNSILTSRDQTIRMISGTGTMLWDQALGVPVTDVSMTPGGELIAAGGGSRIRLITGSGVLPKRFANSSFSRSFSPAISRKTGSARSSACCCGANGSGPITGRRKNSRQ